MGGRFTIFCFVLLCIRGQIPITSPRGAYIRRGDLTEGFWRYDFSGAYIWKGLIHGGAYFRNFTVWLFTFLPLTSRTVVRTVKKVAINILQSDWLLAVLISPLNRTVF